ncbi:MAG TPA: hypothetical protein VGC13_04820 [Longimicrobium sp.]|jgi:hypothetical protein|uniref:hypothetical protein n=1 Tax=Longimicrobium sp. TaxID=2029185 RepID=UPI002ED956EE
MKRSLLLACAALVAGCASGADVADDADASPDSAVVEALEGMAPGENVEGKQTTP